MVDAVRFRGNHAIPSGDLAPIIATERTGIFRRWFGWKTGVLTCLDSVELRRDETRVHDLYAQRGYPGTVVHSGVSRRGLTRAQVTFTIVESAPIRVDSVAILGLPPETADVSAFTRHLRGAPMDDSLLTAAAESIQVRLRSAGYARAQAPVRTVHVDSAARRATVELQFRPGHVIWVGSIAVTVTAVGKSPALPERQVRSMLRFHTGERYDAQLVSRSQRDLFNLELYGTVRIDTGTARIDTGTVRGDTGTLRSDSLPASDTLPIFVQLTEGARRRVRAGGGWGTLDCFRTQERFVEQNFLGAGHRLELNGRLSKLGLASPFSSLQGLCAPRMRDDPFSQHVNYYVGATANWRGVFGTSLRPTLTVYSERRSEFLVYEQSVSLGVLASLTRELGPQLLARMQYRYEDGKTVADGAVSCTTFGFCRSQDLASFLQPSPIHSAGVQFVKNPLMPTYDPVTGQRWQTEARLAHTEIARKLTLNFMHLMAEAAAYRPIGELVVVAVRAQAGVVVAPNDRSFLLPPQERFYGGGQNSVRGFNQNLLGPGSYIVGTIDTVKAPDGTPVGVARPANGYQRIAPSGGNAMWLANLEVRTRRGWPGDLLRWVAFVDAGRVWNTNDAFSVTNSAWRVTPGFGARLLTPLGPFRVDIGYNPYPPEAGPAFLVRGGDLKAGIPGRAICVSPGSTESIASAGTGGAAFCPATFTPDKRGGLLPRLTFHFSVGNAF